MIEASQKAAGDEHVEAAIGWDRDPGVRARALWDQVLGPTVRRYGSRRPDWCWDEGLARRLLHEWWDFTGPEPVAHRTIAPLHNLRAPDEAIEVAPDLFIRPLTDEDRRRLWRGFGPHTNPSSISPDLRQLEHWTHAAELRWVQPRRPPHADDQAHERIAELVSALRLHHPGVVGTSIIWTFFDPPDASVLSPLQGERLFASRGAGHFIEGIVTHVARSCGPALARLVTALRAARSDRAFALASRRFNGSYERPELEDALVDLWISFEALLVPDSTVELSYRAALRIARLVGHDAAGRRLAFSHARRSYTARSNVVHGAKPPHDLPAVLRETRELARLALRAWALDPPQGGVPTLDDELLT